MRIIHAAAFASVAALLLSTAPSFADQADQVGFQDMSGMATLGIDIGNAGNTPDSVQQFLATQSPDVSAHVLASCDAALRSQSEISPQVASFCQNATGQL